MIRLLLIILIMTVKCYAIFTLPNYYIRQNLNLVGGWNEGNKTDPRVIRISEWLVNNTFHYPYEFEIISVKTQVVAGLNYDILLKTYLNNSLPSTLLPTILYNYAINYLHFYDLALLCWSKDRFLVWDHFGNLTISNHTEIKRSCKEQS